MRIYWKCFNRRYYQAVQYRLHEFPLHDHDHAEVLWILDGTTRHRINGVEQTLNPGDLVLVRPWDHHSFHPGANGVVIANVGFPTTVFRQVCLQHFSGETGLWPENRELPSKRSLAAAEWAAMERSLQDLAMGRDLRWEIERFLFNLAHMLGSQTVPDSKEVLPEWLRRACLQIQEPSQFLGGTRQFANLCGRSPEHVARTLRRLSGRSPTEVINDARIRYAAGQLLTTDASVLEIALNSGFQGLAHFYREFHARHGMAPREFRIRNQGNGLPR